jgi:hypothetical protein
MERRASWLRAASEEKGRVGPEVAAALLRGSRPWLCAARRAQGGVEERGRGRASEKGASGPHLVDSGVWTREGHAVEDGSGWPHVIHGGAASSAWRPHRHFIERVAGDGIGSLVSSFGPSTSRMLSWALNQVY